MQIGYWNGENSFLLHTVIAEAKQNAFEVLEAEIAKGNSFGAGYAAQKVVRVMRLFNSIVGDPFPIPDESEAA